MRFFLKYGLLFVSWCLRLFPYRLSMAVGGFLGFAIFYLIPFRKKLIMENMRLAFSESMSELEIKTLARRNYQHYGRVFMDFLVTVSWKKEDYLKNVKLEGLENVKEVLREGKGLFFLSCHLGSWELAIGVTAAAGIPLNVVVKHARNKAVESFLQWYRKKTGAGIFLESYTHYEILHAIKKNQAVGFVMDQFMGPPIGLPVSFFGKLAGTAVSLALLLERRNAPVILVYCFRDSKGYPHVVFKPPIQFSELSSDRTKRLYERTQIVNDVLEQTIRKHPEQWLWLHRRWKPFKGLPRWRLSSVAVSLLLGLGLLMGCSSTEVSKTGIDIPPDPIVVVPKDFQSVEEVEAEETSKKKEQAANSIEHAQYLGIVKKRKETKKKKRKPRVKKKKKKKIKKVPKGYAFEKIPPERIPFQIGERMEIDLHWMALPAGRAIMEVREGGEFNGRKTYRFWGNVLSSRLVDTIYHVDNTIESYVDFEGIIPYKFLLHMVESKQLKETRVVFDHVKSKAHYWSKRVSKKWGDETLNRADEFIPSAQDMFSGLYFVRTLDFKLNKTEKFYVYEKGQMLEVKFTPVANELVNTKVGVFQAWKLSLELYLNNQLKQTGKTYFWVSDDANRFIVKFDAKIKIGSLKGSLVGLREKK